MKLERELELCSNAVDLLLVEHDKGQSWDGMARTELAL
jgi:hypothetical protein